MLYIILPIHNRKATTERFIKSLASQTYQEYRLILIDDGSDDGSDKMVLEYLPNTHIIYGDGNLWWGGSLQKGYEWIINNSEVKDDDIVLIINDDTEFEDDFLQNAVNLLQKQDNILLKSYCIDTNDKDQKLQNGYVKFEYKNMKFSPISNQEEANCTSTRGLFFRVLDFKDIGGFFPKILPHYGSDDEWTIRAVKKGKKIVCDDSLFLRFDASDTGINNYTIKYSSFSDYLKKYFSLRNMNNPYTMINLAWLTSPKDLYLVKNIFKIIVVMFRELLKAMIRGNNVR